MCEGAEGAAECSPDLKQPCAHLRPLRGRYQSEPHLHSKIEVYLTAVRLTDVWKSECTPQDRAGRATIPFSFPGIPQRAATSRSRASKRKSATMDAIPAFP